jgi:hypothetical protein
MCFGAAGKMVALYDTGKTFTLRHPGNIDQVTRLKQAHLNPTARLNAISVIKSKLPKIPDWLQSLEMPALGRIEPFRLAKSKLNRIISLLGHRFNLRNNTWASLNSRYCLRFTIFSKYLGHPQFSTDNTLNHIFSTIDLLVM